MFSCELPITFDFPGFTGDEYEANLDDFAGKRFGLLETVAVMKRESKTVNVLFITPQKL